MGRLDILDMVDFNVILGKDCLALYYTILNNFSKIVIIDTLGILRFDWKGTPSSCPKGVISFVHAC